MNQEYFQEIGVWPEDFGKTARNYVVGLTLSALFTLAAYFVVAHHMLARNEALIVVVALALAQCAAQLVFFLHLGRASKERLVAFWAAAFVILILVAGSLWIMFSLRARMQLPPAQMQQYMDSQSGI